MFFSAQHTPFPEELNQALVRFFEQEKNGFEAFLKSSGTALKVLWEELAKNKGQGGGAQTKHYSLDGKQAKAYAAYYLPANLLKIFLILEEMRLLNVLPFSANVTAKKPVVWADLGSGPGTLGCGLLWWLKQNGGTEATAGLSFDFWNLDQSNHFLETAQRLQQHMRSEWRASASISESRFSTETISVQKEKIFSWLSAKKPHVVSLMNSWVELNRSLEERTAWLSQLTEMLRGFSKLDGIPRWIILTEPGTKDHSRDLLSARDKLRQESDVEILLPCFGNRPCGALEKPSDWCHEEARLSFPQWHDRLGENAGLRKEQILFSYLVVRVGQKPEAQASDPSPWRDTVRRCVSQRLEQKGSTECFLCTPTGKIKARVLHSKTTPSNEGFLKVARGDLFESVQMDAKGSVESFKKLV